MTSRNPENTTSSTPSSLPETSSSPETRDTFLLRTAKKIGFGALRETVSRVNEKYEEVMRKGIVTDYPLEITHPSLHLQNETFKTYEENVEFSRSPKEKQDEAYTTYEGNIAVSSQLENTRIEADKKELKKLKRKYILGRMGSAAMWVPGLDIIGESIQESKSASMRRKAKIKKYKQVNGTLTSNLSKRYTSNKNRNREQKRIIEDRATLINQLESQKNGLPN